MGDRNKQVMASGGFDFVHIGHINLLEGAYDYGDVIVALNSDQWLVKKKGYCFMPWGERARILLALDCVHQVVAFDDSDGTVCKALEKYKPDYFANGGDRIVANPEEHRICKELGIIELFNIGGGKIRSSSELIKAIR